MAKSDFLTAEQIAEMQLHAALKMWHKREFVSCITLAGAAEEILGRRLRKLGQETSFDNMKAAVVKIAKKLGETDQNIDRDIAQLMNQTKNKLKHYAEDDHLEFDLRADAEEMLERAIANYTMLTNNVLPGMSQFWAEVNKSN